MEVLILTSFVSVVLAAAGVALFVWSARERTFDQSDRLALLLLSRTSLFLDHHASPDRPKNLHTSHALRIPSACRLIRRARP